MLNPIKNNTKRLHELYDHEALDSNKTLSDKINVNSSTRYQSAELTYHIGQKKPDSSAASNPFEHILFNQGALLRSTLLFDKKKNIDQQIIKNTNIDPMKKDFIREEVLLTTAIKKKRHPKY